MFQGARCPACNPPWVRRTASWPDGSTRRWRRTRAAQLAHEPLCEKCGALADVADHKDGTDYDTQRYDLEMTRSLCARCHGTRTAEQGNAAKRTKRGTGD